MFYNNFLKACNLVGKAPTTVLSEAGISKSANTRWQNGENPTPANVMKLSDYFGISPSDLTGETRLKTSKGEVVRDGDISAEAMTVARAYDRADQRAKDMVRLALEPFGLSAASEEAM